MHKFVIIAYEWGNFWQPHTTENTWSEIKEFFFTQIWLAVSRADRDVCTKYLQIHCPVLIVSHPLRHGFAYEVEFDVAVLVVPHMVVGAVQVHALWHGVVGLSWGPPDEGEGPQGGLRDPHPLVGLGQECAAGPPPRSVTVLWNMKCFCHSHRARAQCVEQIIIFRWWPYFAT